MTRLAGWERALECTRAALDHKAYDLVVLETGRLTSIADYFVICSGRSDTQVQAIAQAMLRCGGSLLVRRERGGHEPYLVQALGVAHLLGGAQMPQVDGVERPAENADAAHARI